MSPSLVVDEPEVSVIIPARNARATIERALASVAAQAGVRVETIVIDDASSDGTGDLVRSLGMTGVRVLPMAERRGVSGARNAGIEAARGAFIAFLDADDAWLPGKLVAQLPFLRADPAVTLVSCDSVTHNIHGQQRRYHEWVPIAQGPDAWKSLLAANFLPTPTVLCRRADVLRLGGFDPGLTFGEDLDLWIRLAMAGEVRVVDQVLVHIHNQPSGLSFTQPRSEVEFVLPMIARHVRAAGDRLSADERREILGCRNFNIGYQTYLLGYPWSAAPLLLRSALFGWRRTRSLFVFVDCLLGAPWRRLRRPNERAMQGISAGD